MGDAKRSRRGLHRRAAHDGLKATERIQAAVLERADPSLSKQQRLAALHSALPLVNPTLITRWQQQAAAYPHALAVAMVREHLRFRPAWEQKRLAQRHDVLVLYDPSVQPRSSSCSSCWGSTASTILAGGGWID